MRHKICCEGRFEIRQESGLSTVRRVWHYVMNKYRMPDSNVMGRSGWCKYMEVRLIEEEGINNTVIHLGGAILRIALAIETRGLVGFR